MLNIVNELYAKRIQRFYEHHFFIADSVNIFSYNKDGVFSYSITCDSAYVDQKENIFTAMGRVVVVNPDGNLKTNLLKWNRSDDKLTAPGDVVLVHQDNIIIGTSLETNLNFDFIKLKEVSAEGSIDEENIDF